MASTTTIRDTGSIDIVNQCDRMPAPVSFNLDSNLFALPWHACSAAAVHHQPGRYPYIKADLLKGSFPVPPVVGLVPLGERGGLFIGLGIRV